MPGEIFKNEFEGYVLAGGKSLRMGTNKAFLEIENETFVERAVKALTPVCRGRVKVILNQNQPASDFSPFDYIRDVFAERGAPGGIHAALSNSNCEWAIVLACDLPLVSSETITGLSKIALDSPANIAAVVPRQSDGKFQPLCACYRPSLCLPQLTKLLQTTAAASVRDFLKLIPVVYIDGWETPSADRSVFFNVNKPEDYEFLPGK